MSVIHESTMINIEGVLDKIARKLFRSSADHEGGVMAGLREIKKQRTREMILKNSMELFTQKGVDEVGMRELAQVCGLGIGTYYNYFKSKEDVIFSLFRENLNTAITNKPFRIEDGASDADNLASNYKVIFQELMIHKNIADEYLTLAYNTKNISDADSVAARLTPQIIDLYWGWVQPLFRSSGIIIKTDEEEGFRRMFWHHFLSSFHAYTSSFGAEESVDYIRFTSRHLINGLGDGGPGGNEGMAGFNSN